MLSERFVYTAKTQIEIVANVYLKNAEYDLISLLYTRLVFFLSFFFLFYKEQKVSKVLRQLKMCVKFQYTVPNKIYFSITVVKSFKLSVSFRAFLYHFCKKNYMPDTS